MICIIALPIFLLLGIFSAKYRQLAKEAVECTFLKVTLRPCDTGLNKKIKASVVSAFSKPKWLGRFIYKRFEILSIIFSILIIVSTIYVIIGGANFYLYGNCNGPNSDAFCVFDPTGANEQVSTTQVAECSVNGNDPSLLSYESLELDKYPTISRDGAKHTVVVIGCYSCKYTRENIEIFRKISQMPNVNYSFAHLPLNDLAKNLTRYEECIYAQNPQKYWEFNEMLFNINFTTANETIFEDFMRTNNLTVSCVYQDATILKANHDVQTLVNAGIYGTPTVFIDGKAIVGPKPERVYKRLLK